MRVKLLEEVRFREGVVAGYTNVEHRGLRSWSEVFDEQLKHPAPRPQRETGCQGHSARVLVENRPLGGGALDQVMVMRSGYVHRLRRAVPRSARFVRLIAVTVQRDLYERSE